MYLLTPILLVFLSLCGILFIVWRKRLYIRKLVAVDVPNQNGSTSLSNKEFLGRLSKEMFPEMMEQAGNIKFNEYKDAWLVEAEKFLRRLRLLSLRMDRLSATLIHKIRNVYDKPEVLVETKPTEQTIVAPPVRVEEKTNEEIWKKEEQKLIIEIAKNPKDSKLYDLLGDLYIKMGDYTDAKESFEAAMELDANNEELKKKHSMVLEKIDGN